MHRIKRFETISSTNDYLKKNYSGLEDGDVVTANHQTKGRGRNGRTWLDDDSSLLFSVLLKDRLDAKTISLLPLLTGTAIFLAFKDLGVPSQIKWPNDVMIEGKKSTGILLEAITDSKLEAVIIGIGINVNNTDFDPLIKDKATSLLSYLGHKTEKSKVLDSFLSHFDILYGEYLKGNHAFLSILKAHSFLDGKEVSLNYYGENRHGRAIGVDDSGQLVIDTAEGPLTVQAGEVTLQSVYQEKSR